MNPDFLLRWQGEHLLEALHEVAQGERFWSGVGESYNRPGDRTSGSTGAPGFLVVGVRELAPLGIPTHQLRLGKQRYASLIAAQPVNLQRMIVARLSERHWQPVWRYGGESRCKVCSSSLRLLLDEELLEGTLSYAQLVDVAGWRGLDISPSMLSRHKALHPVTQALLCDEPVLAAFAVRLARIAEPLRASALGAR